MIFLFTLLNMSINYWNPLRQRGARIEGHILQQEGALRVLGILRGREWWHSGSFETCSILLRNYQIVIFFLNQETGNKWLKVPIVLTVIRSPSMMALGFQPCKKLTDYFRPLGVVFLIDTNKKKIFKTSCSSYFTFFFPMNFH